MTSTRAEACRPTRERLDAYLSGELPDAERRLVDEHLGACAPCAGEGAARRLLRRELTALLGEADQDETAIEERILARIAAERQATGLRRGLFVAAAGLAVAAGVAVQWRTPAATPGADAPAPSLELAIYDATSRAHLACAVQARFTGEPPTREVALQALERYAAVLAPVEAELGRDDTRLLDAHVCRWPREFGHVVLARGGHRVSVLVTPESGALPPVGVLLETPDRSWVRGLERGGYALAASAGAGHAAFAVSNEDAARLRGFGLRLLPRVLGSMSGGGAGGE